MVYYNIGYYNTYVVWKIRKPRIKEPGIDYHYDHRIIVHLW